MWLQGHAKLQREQMDIFENIISVFMSVTTLDYVNRCVAQKNNLIHNVFIHDKFSIDFPP